jgi:hypothetical protein
VEVEYEDGEVQPPVQVGAEKPSTVRARSSAYLLRLAAGVAVALGVIGILAVYGVFFQDLGSDEDRWQIFLTATIPAVAVGLVSLIAVGLLLAGSALVDLYAERVEDGSA